MTKSPAAAAAAARRAADGIADVADDRAGRRGSGQTPDARRARARLTGPARTRGTAKQHRVPRSASDARRALTARHVRTPRSAGWRRTARRACRRPRRSRAAASGPASSRTMLTFQAPRSQTSETTCVRHDCCGWTVAPLPTMPTYQTATVAALRREALDPVADRDAAQQDHRPRDGVGSELRSRLSARLLECAIKLTRVTSVDAIRVDDRAEARGSSSTSPSNAVIDSRPRRRLRRRGSASWAHVAVAACGLSAVARDADVVVGRERGDARRARRFGCRSRCRSRAVRSAAAAECEERAWLRAQERLAGC